MEQVLSAEQTIKLFKQAKKEIQALQEKIIFLEKRIADLEADPFKMPFG